MVVLDAWMCHVRMSLLQRCRCVVASLVVCRHHIQICFDRSLVALLLKRATQVFQLCDAMATDWWNYVATVHEDSGEETKQHHLMPVNGAPGPIFLEANVEQRLRMIFQNHDKRWYISEEEKGSGGEKKKETILAFLDLGHKFPDKQDQWTSFGHRRPRDSHAVG